VSMGCSVTSGQLPSPADIEGYPNHVAWEGTAPAADPWITARSDLRLCLRLAATGPAAQASNEVDGVIGPQCCLGRLVQVGAEEDAAQCLTCMKLLSSVDAAAARR